MELTERVKQVSREYPKGNSNPSELLRLQRFILRMKDAGILRTGEYNLPLPNTLGRSVAVRQINDKAEIVMQRSSANPSVVTIPARHE